MKKTEKIIKLYTEKLILTSDPLFPLWNRENFMFSKQGKWNYIDNCIIRSVLMMYDLSRDVRLLDYAVRFIDCYVEDNGDIPSINPLDYNLDNINGAKNLTALYKLTGNEKYRLAVDKLYTQQICSQPRLDCGNFYHKAIYPMQIWLDGSYMALPFLAEYAVQTKDNALLDDVKNQLENIIRLMKDSNTGLYYHGYEQSRITCWSDKTTGLSQEFWLRAMGWYASALADICEITQDYAPELSELCAESLCSLINAVSQYITHEGMLCQLPAKPDLKDNYPETSGTLLFAYASLKAYRLGVGGENIKNTGIKLFSAVVDNYITFNTDNLPVLSNTCLVAGLGGSQNRDGSAEYYLSEPVVKNEAKGIAPLIMAYTELMRILKV
ncbi:MAG: glycoside hydrolase family 88 protein [Ruminococcus sp.]|nr:glycoside hydrolase family 88 protein [Ruminococcus sp.]